MKIFLLLLTVLGAFKLFGADTTPSSPKQGTSNLGWAKGQQDPEAAENIKKLFYNTLDPGSILKDIPPKFVDLENVDPLKEDFESMGEFYDKKTSKFILPGFLYPSEVAPLATVVGGFEGQEMVTPLNKLLVKIDTNIEKDKTYSVLRLLHVVKRREGKGKWYHYIYVGEVVVSNFEEKKRAVVITQPPSVVRTGDLLVTQIPSEKTLDLSQGKRAIFKDKARIISLFELDTLTVGEGGFAFLDKGEKDGLVLNQVLDVYLDKTAHDLKGIDSDEQGTLQIVDLSSTSSTAYIITSRHDFTIGDYASSN